MYEKIVAGKTRLLYWDGNSLQRERERAVGILSIGCWVLFFLSGKWSLHKDYR